jgi:hypothetical protein
MHTKAIQSRAPLINIPSAKAVHDFIHNGHSHVGHASSGVKRHDVLIYLQNKTKNKKNEKA